MPRPANKNDLLSQSKRNFDSLMDFIDTLSPEEQSKDFTPGKLNRNIRDVLMHLHHWHLLMLEWYAKGMKGEKPDMPAKNYSWKDTPALNRWIQEHYSQTKLQDAIKNLKHSYQEVQRIIERHTDEELFEKKKYFWTGSTSLGAYLVSASSSHYQWALKLIRKAKKA